MVIYVFRVAKIEGFGIACRKKIKMLKVLILGCVI